MDELSNLMKNLGIPGMENTLEKYEDTLSEEEILEKLSNGARIYDASRHSNPYKVGDIVTPREGFNIRNAGKFCIVVETFKRKIVAETGKDAESTSDRRAVDMRVMTLAEGDKGDIICFPAESWCYRLIKSGEQE